MTSLDDPRCGQRVVDVDIAVRRQSQGIGAPADRRTDRDVAVAGAGGVVRLDGDVAMVQGGAQRLVVIIVRPGSPRANGNIRRINQPLPDGAIGRGRGNHRPASDCHFRPGSFDETAIAALRSGGVKRPANIHGTAFEANLAADTIHRSRLNLRHCC